MLLPPESPFNPGPCCLGGLGHRSTNKANVSNFGSALFPQQLRHFDEAGKFCPVTLFVLASGLFGQR